MIGDKIITGGVTFENRLVLQPMEGCDCAPDGSPGALTVRKYLKAAGSGAGTVWMEASAVCPEGCANGRQMMITEKNVREFAELIGKMREASPVRQVYILQLTHSGRQSVVPITGYANALYEKERPVTEDRIATDEYLDTIPALYAKTAELAYEAGFDGVDVKACHGYLLSEMLSAFERPGKYGGSFENRARLFLDCVKAVSAVTPAGKLLTSRLGVTEMVPYPYGFGTDETGEYVPDEPDRLIELLIGCGVRILNVTVGNPYFVPHINRPFRRGPYTPPETPETGLARFAAIEKHIKEKFPELTVVASGLSYHREMVFDEAEKLLSSGACDLVGIGRMWLAYPEIYNDYKNGTLERRKCCLTCSKCTELMRLDAPSGCAVFDEYYRELYRRLTK